MKVDQVLFTESVSNSVSGFGVMRFLIFGYLSVFPFVYTSIIANITLRPTNDSMPTNFC